MQPSEIVRRVLDYLPPAGVEEVSLADAGGRVLALGVTRACPDPPFTRSRVDGYALALADLGRDAGGPLTVTVAGTTAAGEEPPGCLAAGTAWRVMAGAALGQGVGAVVPFEDAPQGDRAHPGDQLSLPGRPPVGENVIPAGLRGQTGSLVLAEGTLLGPLELARLAGAGAQRVTVRRRPRVTIRSSGSELVEPGGPLPPGKVYASNPHLLAGLVSAWGGESLTGPPVPDRLPAVIQALTEAAAAADVVILTGGVGPGDRDLTRAALAELGWPLILDDPAFLTGRSCAAAQASLGQLVFLLPGGPGSCLAAFTFLAIPAIASLSGRQWSTVAANLDGPPVHRERPLPVRLRLEAGRLWATPRPHVSGVPDGGAATDGFLPPVTGAEEARPLADVWPVQPVFPLTGWRDRK
ncbi:MAG: molybdopterin molybdotransferase MoeA [Chitinophagales bacterium]